MTEYTIGSDGFVFYNNNYAASSVFVIFTSFLRLQSEIGAAILQTDDPNQNESLESNRNKLAESKVSAARKEKQKC